MKKGKLILAVAFIALSLFIIINSLSLPPSKNGVPGPATWPILVSIIMFISAVTVAIKALKEKDERAVNIAGMDQVRVYITMGILILYLVAIKFIGFAVSTFVMLYVLITWFGNYKLFIRVLTSLIITAVVYTVFQYVLKVPFRFGILF